MNANLVLYIVVQVIKGTPLYVWIIFSYLISRGINALKTKELVLKKMLIMPCVFMLWGLDKMLYNFTNLAFDFIVYLIMVCIGACIGYLLYNGRRKVFYKDGAYYRTGSFLPLLIMLTNFSIKYILNVMVAISPSLYISNQFCLFYSILSGFSVGLFIGGFLQAYTAYKNCNVQLQIQ